MVVVPQGKFTMGAPVGEEERENLPSDRRGRSVTAAFGHDPTQARNFQI